MSLESFAERYRAKVRRDDADGTDAIPGRLGQIYEYGDGLLAVMFLPAGQASARKWAAVKRQAEVVGMTLRQSGDDEGAFTFNPDDPKQCRLALKIAGVKVRRQMSPEQLARLSTFEFF
jgi:hypothetical protein